MKRSVGAKPAKSAQKSASKVPSPKTATTGNSRTAGNGGNETYQR